MKLRFEWDRAKSQSNHKKHKVTFDEAKTVFLDERGLVIPDPIHSTDEARFILLGLSRSLRVLVVIHCYRENDEVIRIISARRATKNEQKQYYRDI